MSKDKASKRRAKKLAQDWLFALFGKKKMPMDYTGEGNDD